MVIYEVNLEVEAEVGVAFATWLGPHIEEMLRIDGFVDARWYYRRPEDEGALRDGRILWTIHYVVRDRESLDRYLEGPAEEMRQDALDRFRGHFTAARRILMPRR